ncbi:hypothetical protein B0T24DRAFT_153050 [Lasiosphaeria ovina]|uniref:Secreted protein n=1 Tax=Lasiosphaeria ovina TaxID=92902 RepID=A0AAE0KND9_9PEZI|nr:hypothetical protein B0T24DRAFT_153050 [Lasiosphaeria ovina]
MGFFLFFFLLSRVRSPGARSIFLFFSKSSCSVRGSSGGGGAAGKDRLERDHRSILVCEGSPPLSSPSLRGRFALASAVPTSSFGAHCASVR